MFEFDKRPTAMPIWALRGFGRGFLMLSETLHFPAATNIRINMMPFVMGDPSSVPAEYHAYLPFVDQALQVVPAEKEKIGYLTIDESFVEVAQHSDARDFILIVIPTSFVAPLPSRHSGEAAFKGKEGFFSPRMSQTLVLPGTCACKTQGQTATASICVRS